MPDPFIEGRPRSRASDDLDAPMLDCTRLGGAVGRLPGYDGKDRKPLPLPREAVVFDDLMMDSPGQASIGAAAPTNTRNCSATNSPQLPPTRSYSPELGYHGRDQDRLGAATTSLKPTPESRTVALTCGDSDVAMSLPSPRTANQTLENETAGDVRAMPPPRKIRGRKVTKEADFEISTDDHANGDYGITRVSQDATERSSAANRKRSSGDGKRKRTLTTHASKKGTATDPLSLSSPRKVSKMADLQEPSDENDPDASNISNSRTKRPPLASLDNILQ